MPTGARRSRWSPPPQHPTLRKTRTIQLLVRHPVATSKIGGAEVAAPAWMCLTVAVLATETRPPFDLRGALEATADGDTLLVPPGLPRPRFRQRARNLGNPGLRWARRSRRSGVLRSRRCRGRETIQSAALGSASGSEGVRSDRRVAATSRGKHKGRGPQSVRRFDEEAYISSNGLTNRAHRKVLQGMASRGVPCICSDLSSEPTARAQHPCIFKARA